MVESGQRIRRVDFASRLHPALPVEVLDFDDLRRRLKPDHFTAPERPSFTIFILMETRRGSHTVDFARIAAKPGRLIQVRPGQIQTFDSEIDATLLLAEPIKTSAHPWFPGHAVYGDLDEVDRNTAVGLIDALRHYQEEFAGDPATRRLMVSMVETLTALFERSATSVETHLPEPYIAFRSAVEHHMTHKHDVTEYAAMLGYSPRTLSRACQAATGRTAKQVLTERLLLEAKRLLAHTQTSAASISGDLGFSEPTNFAKFFIRHTGMTPGTFRRQQSL